MSPTPRVVAALLFVGASALVLPVALVLACLSLLIVLTAFDAYSVRRPPLVHRELPGRMARGASSELKATVVGSHGRVRLRQASPPGLHVEPDVADGDLLAARITGTVRGIHLLPALSVRCWGPLGLARWDHAAGQGAEISVVPDLPAAHRLVRRRREGRLDRTEGKVLGSLGLGTELESVREWSPDDDIRQVNWRATSRVGRLMSNQYRVDQDRDVICVLDSGRMMRAPIGTATRFDLALDAATAIAVMADDVGDHVGAVAFGSGIRRRLPPRRKGASGVVSALFDLQPLAEESNYELAFRSVGTKRALVVVLTDLADDLAAQSLMSAIPVLTRRHAVVVASVIDPELESYIKSEPTRPFDVYAAAVALDLAAASERAAQSLRSAGATVVQAHAKKLSAQCTAAYLSLKARARL